MRRRQLESGPPGLRCGRVHVDLAQAVLQEAKECWGDQYFFEVGCSSGIHSATAAPPYLLTKLPSLEALIRAAMEELGERCPAGGLENVNVIFRWYKNGCGIRPHTDYPCFGPLVFGCVLQADDTRNTVLEFERPHCTDENVQEYYPVQEEQGTCVCQSGEARENWRHSVPPVSDKERIALSWRWLGRCPVLLGHTGDSVKRD